MHPTIVECHYSISNIAGKRLLQLDTMGSTDRENPGKLSQTLQMDENGARQLIALLKAEFAITE